jgi:hypothetical protein
MKTQLILAEIKAAKSGVTEAENDLAKLLQQLQAQTRAQKTTISRALQKAFDKLRESREHLVTLEKLARASKD